MVRCACPLECASWWMISVWAWEGGWRAQCASVGVSNQERGRKSALLFCAGMMKEEGADSRQPRAEGRVFFAPCV